MHLLEDQSDQPTLILAPLGHHPLPSLIDPFLLHADWGLEVHEEDSLHGSEAAAHER
mgnify:CR=1 FL=1